MSVRLATVVERLRDTIASGTAKPCLLIGGGAVRCGCRFGIAGIVSGRTLRTPTATSARPASASSATEASTTSSSAAEVASRWRFRAGWAQQFFPLSFLIVGQQLINFRFSLFADFAHRTKVAFLHGGAAGRVCFGSDFGQFGILVVGQAELCCNVLSGDR